MVRQVLKSNPSEGTYLQSMGMTNGKVIFINACIVDRREDLVVIKNLGWMSGL